MLNRDLAAILLPDQAADDSSLQAPLIAADYEVGNLEEWQWVKCHLQACVGRLVRREQLVHKLASHGLGAC